MKIERKYTLFSNLAFIGMIAVLFIATQAVFAAQDSPRTYKTVIDPPDNGIPLLFKGKVNGSEIIGWWLDATVDGEPLEVFLKAHPKFKFVITTGNESRIITGEDYFKTGLLFPFGNSTLALVDESGQSVFDSVKIQAGGGPGSSTGWSVVKRASEDEGARGRGMQKQSSTPTHEPWAYCAAVCCRYDPRSWYEYGCDGFYERIIKIQAPPTYQPNFK